MKSNRHWTLSKFLFVSVPLVETLYPSAAYGALKPVIIRNGYKCELVDVNLYLHKNYDEDTVDEINNWSMLAKDDISDHALAVLEQAYNDVLIPKIKDADWIAISVFSFYSCRPTVRLLQLLKQQRASSKILVGGNGVSSSLAEYNHTEFGMWCLSNGLVDYAMFGEGEVALDELLKGNDTYPGINDPEFEQIRYIESLELPDYSGINWDEYQDPRIMITGSRGCVRKCTFCDIGVTWPKFAYRKASHLVDEIKRSVYEHGLTKFEFTDSLINGSITNFYEFNNALANEKAKDPLLKDVTYTGQFICRNKNKMPESHYEAMHYAGCSQITVGIESFSERVRADIKKKFSDADVDYHLEMCGRWNIPNIFLMIIGYPTETLADHQANVRALHRYKQYSDAGIIFMMRWGLTMHIYDGTPISNMMDEMQIHVAGQGARESVFNWVSALNPDLTLAERIRRRIELHELSAELGYAMPNSRKELISLLEIANTYKYSGNKIVFPNITGN